MEYQPQEIERKWQAFWASQKTFAATVDQQRPKYYVLDMFPYPSGAGLHVGHPLGYIASDIIARYKRHQGFNVLHPMGYDSFGLPAEQYALQTGQHPAITTKENIARYRRQLDKIGFSFDWQREVRTSDPAYYRWTQYLFLQFFQSWYDWAEGRARPIEELITHFSRQGTRDLHAAGGEELHFSAPEWAGFNDEARERILQNFRLAYRSESTVNWCPALGTVLANDEVVNGRSERGGHPVEQKKMLQWSLRISAYADRLLEGLDDLDWPESIKEAQRNWIGRSEGAQLRFAVQGFPEESIQVFTTRPDTIFGVSFMTLAPEHPLVEKITIPERREEVQAYQQQAARKSERERMSEAKVLSGCFTGAYALHPFTDEPLPIWIGDYVLAGYGTGAVMAVPAHDQRDWEFAEHFGLPKLPVIEGGNIGEAAYDSKEGKVINSDFLNGLPVPEAIQKAIEVVEEKSLGRGRVNYRLRDAIFGRQRYWGEPIPIYYANGIPRQVRLEHLPLELPPVDAYKPTADGEPPLARARNWYYHPEIGLTEASKGYPLETTTMPGWAGSSWYDLRYMDAHNEEAFVSRQAQAYWQGVDLYIGGSEHATGHLLYSRFWHHFLYDRGFINRTEPFQKMINQGMITGSSAFAHRQSGTNRYLSAERIGDRETEPIHVEVSLVNSQNELDLKAFKAWREDARNAEFETAEGRFTVTRETEKMSKSKYNVVNPDEIIAQYGADTLRMYEMFLGPLEQSKPWNTAGISGVHNFLRKLWRLFFRASEWQISDEAANPGELKVLHTLIKKVREDLDTYSFNTSVSAFMIAVNQLQELQCNKRSVLEPLVVLLSPFAPHVAEELWDRLGHPGSVSGVAFPEANPEYLKESVREYPVQINGKLRFTQALSLELDAEGLKEAVLALEQTQKYLENKAPRKVIAIPGKIINIVV